MPVLMDGSGYLWGGLALFGMFAMVTRPDPVPLPDPNAKSERVEVIEPVADRAGNGIGSLEIKRAADSHFYVEALVNGIPVRFVVDTAATKVVLTKADAQRAGLAAGEYNLRGRGAGGEVRLMPITIARLGLGVVTAEQVPAMVAEDGLPVSLLGQSYLSRIGSVAIEGDTMTLR